MDLPSPVDPGSRDIQWISMDISLGYHGFQSKDTGVKIPTCFDATLWSIGPYCVDMRRSSGSSREESRKRTLTSISPSESGYPQRQVMMLQGY